MASDRVPLVHNPVNPVGPFAVVCIHVEELSIDVALAHPCVSGALPPLNLHLLVVHLDHLLVIPRQR